MTNKTDDEDEEKTCLLAELQQDLSSPEELTPIAKVKADDNAASNNHLATGDAEKAFYEEANSNLDLKDQQQQQQQHSMKACIIHNSISFPSHLELERARNCEFCTLTPNVQDVFQAEEEKGLSEGPILSVDVHCPPEVLSSAEVLSQVDKASTSKPCKHSVNRFQRFYSAETDDSSNSNTNSSSKNSKNDMFVPPPIQQPQSKSNKKFYGDNKVGDVLQNVDKIETICESNLPATPDLQIGTEIPSSKPFAMSELPERLRHCSEAAAMALAQKFKMDKYFAETAKLERADEVKGEGSRGSRNFTNDEIPRKDKNLKEKILPTSLVNPNAKFDFYIPNNHDNYTLDNDSNNYYEPSDDYCDSPFWHHLGQKLLPSTNNGNNDNNRHFIDEEKESNYPMLSYCGDYYDDTTHTDIIKKKSIGGLSQSSSTMSMPVCRICQLPGLEPNNPLISPCRCLGSIRFVHNNCLLKWLEVSSRRRSGPPSCELCQYHYLRHKKFVVSHWRYPDCSLRDKILHLFFIFCVLVMIACAGVTIVCFKEDRWPSDRHPGHKYHPGELSPPELISLTCAILFFSAFFLAMYVELKAKYTVYQLLCKFFYMNHEWTVEEYDRRNDVSRKPEIENPG